MKKSILGEYVKYTSLNIMGMIGLSCYIMADTFFVARGLGADGLTALNLAIPVYSFIHGTGLMIGMGGGTRYSIRRSQKKKDAANQTFSHAVYMAAVFAALFVIAGVFMPGMMSRMLGADSSVYPLVKTYLQVILVFAPAFLTNNLLICFVRNDGAPQLSMAAMTLGSLSNVVLDWIFIFPCRMGIFGAAVATGLAAVLSIMILSVYLLRRRNQFHFAKCKAEVSTIAGIAADGLPSLVTELSSGIVMILFNFIILKLEGNTGVAAYGVIANLSLVVLAIYTGIAEGIQPIVSRNYGKGKYENVNAILRYAIITAVFFSAVIYAVVFFQAGWIAELFNSERNTLLQQIAEEGLRLYFTACPFAGFNIVLAVYFASTEHPKSANMISVARGFLVIIPMTLLLSVIGGIIGVWCAFPVTEMAVAGMGLLQLRRK